MMSQPTALPTDDVTEIPEWILNRDAMIGDTLYLAGYRFRGDLMKIRVQRSAVSPLNAAARGWAPRAAPRPRWRADRRVEVDGRVNAISCKTFAKSGSRSEGENPAAEAHQDRPPSGAGAVAQAEGCGSCERSWRDT